MTRSSDLLLLGHRGARSSPHIPENTLESFELALLHGCEGFEFDVRLSADDAAVICHDPESGGLEIANTTSAGLALPRLNEVLGRFASRAFLDIELKVVGLETQLLAALRVHPPAKGFVVSSFLPQILAAIHRLDASIPLGFIYDHAGVGPPAGLPLAWLIPYHTLITRDLINEAHAAGRRVMAWTVNRAEKMRDLASWGIDAIVSDETERLVRTLRTNP